MSTSISAPKGPIQLHYSAGQVVITPEDQDRFVMASRQAISACQSALAFDRFLGQFQTEFLRRLHDWCTEKHDLVDQCYVPFGCVGDCIKVFVVAKSARFEFALSDSIAELEAELLKINWPCDILQVASCAPDELRVFFDPEQSIQVFADGKTRRAQGKS